MARYYLSYTWDERDWFPIGRPIDDGKIDYTLYPTSDEARAHAIPRYGWGPTRFRIMRFDGVTSRTVEEFTVLAQPDKNPFLPPKETASIKKKRGGKKEKKVKYNEYTTDGEDDGIFDT